MSIGESSIPSPLHICFVAHEYHTAFSSPEDLLEEYHSLTDWCEALQACGCKVSAVVRFKTDAHRCRRHVDYYFVQDAYGPQLAFWQIPRRMHRQVVALQADVVHAHNLNKVLQHRDLARRLRAVQTPLLLQNHAETPRFWLRNVLQRQVFSQIDAFLFCAPGQEKIWQDRNIFRPDTPLYYVMEGSTHFQRQSRSAARALTGMQGSPLLLWVGHLDANKDPLTILRAFAQILPQYPHARLYMIYRQEDLIGKVQAYIQSTDLLPKAVLLLGSRPRARLETYLNSADYFVLGSHREGSGYACYGSYGLWMYSHPHRYSFLPDDDR